MKKSLKVFLTLMTISFVTGALVSGCKKDKDENPVEADTESIIEHAAVDAAFDDVSGISDEAASGSLQSYRQHGNLKVLTSCAVVSFDSLSVPKRITVDFGSSNCLCLDGNYRRGKIYVDFTGMYRDSGSTHTISFDNYFVNDNQITGTKTVTNNGRNGNGHLSYTVGVNGSVSWHSSFGGGTSTMTSTRTRVWTAGETTGQWLDDIYMISGSASGTTRKGVNYTMQITDPLKKEIGFRHFTSGVLAFTPGNLATRHIDYSYQNGARDNLARVTVNGITVTINLR